MKPILFRESERNFDTNGIGVLTDATSCIVTEELNGSFELKLEYPVNGIFANELKLRRIILAQPNPYTRAHPFRIYRTRPYLNKIQIDAEHISYDLNGYSSFIPIGTESAQFVETLKSNCVNSDFPFDIEMQGVHSFSYYEYVPPASVRSYLMETTNLPIPCDLTFDRFLVTMDFNGRGKHCDFKVIYGKNLLDYSQENLFQNVYTHIMPFWTDDLGSDGQFIETHFLPEKIISTGVNYSFQRILPVDLTDEVKDGSVTEAQFREIAQNFVEKNNYGIPAPKIDVSFVHNTTGDLKKFERLELGDTLEVVIPQYDVMLLRRCVKTEFDVLQERYKKVELGDTRKGIEHDIYVLKKKVEETRIKIANERIYNHNTYQKKT